MAIEELKKNCSNLEMVRKINQIAQVYNSSFATIENRSITINGITKTFDENGRIVFTNEELDFNVNPDGSTTGIKQIHKYETKYSFPNRGENEHLYIAEAENAIYQWLEDSLIYVCVGKDYEEVSIINGGGAAGFSE